MATRKVHFNFVCEGGKPSHVHDVPASLVTATPQLDPKYRETFQNTITPLVTQHMEECKALSPRQCGVCEKAPTHTVLMTPMSYLHLVDEPQVNVLVTPVCDKRSCDTEGQRGIQKIMMEVSGLGPSSIGAPAPPPQESGPPARGAKCPCGSSRKYKKCCGAQESSTGS